MGTFLRHSVYSMDYIFVTDCTRGSKNNSRSFKTSYWLQSKSICDFLLVAKVTSAVSRTVSELRRLIVQKSHLTPAR